MQIQNIALWAKLKKEYTVDEAACLVCDQEPGTIGEGDPYYGIVQSIKDQLEADGCCKTVNTDYIPNADWRGIPTGTKRALNSKKIVARERLKVWCAANEHRPKVLFPDESAKEEFSHDVPREVDREETDKPISKRGEKTYLNIIGALLDVIKGDCPGMNRHPDFKSEADLIKIIGDKYSGIFGLSERNLSSKLPAAKRSLQDSTKDT